MKAVAEGIAKIRLAGKSITIAPDEIVWESNVVDEKEMGAVIEHSARYELSAGGFITWTLTEYPKGAENFRNTHSDGAEVLQDFNYYLVHTPSD